MWSHLYYYLYIRPHTKNDNKVETAPIAKFIKQELGLVQEENYDFRGQEGVAPWVSLSLVCKKVNGYASGQNPEFFDLVVITGSKKSNIKEYIDLLSPLAKHLNWEFIEEEDIEGNEVVLYQAT